MLLSGGDGLSVDVCATVPAFKRLPGRAYAKTGCRGLYISMLVCSFSMRGCILDVLWKLKAGIDAYQDLRRLRTCNMSTSDTSQYMHTASMHRTSTWIDMYQDGTWGCPFVLPAIRSTATAPQAGREKEMGEGGGGHDWKWVIHKHGQLTF